MSLVPQNLLYTKEHEWVLKLSGGRVRVGITDFAQQALGDIVFVELPVKGAACSKEESLGSVESVKSVTDVYAPVTGSVAEANGKLEEAPGAMNTDPYGDGWIAEIVLKDELELSGLMTAEEYEAYTKEED